MKLHGGHGATVRRFICGGCSVDVFDRRVPAVPFDMDGLVVVRSDLDDDLVPELWGPGDVILCENCGRFSVIEVDLILREATSSEVLASYDTPERQAAAKEMVAIVKSRGLSVRPTLS